MIELRSEKNGRNSKRFGLISALLSLEQNKIQKNVFQDFVTDNPYRKHELKLVDWQTQKVVLYSDTFYSNRHSMFSTIDIADIHSKITPEGNTVEVGLTINNDSTCASGVVSMETDERLFTSRLTRFLLVPKNTPEQFKFINCFKNPTCIHPLA